MFRPTTHRRELLAGRRVVLRAACRSCGATLSTEWALPAAARPEWQPMDHGQAGPSSAQAPVERSLPLAAGAEGWDPGEADAPTTHAAAPSVTDLGDWRLRSAPARTPQQHGEEAEQPRSPAIDPSIDAYLARFSTRVASARDNLRRISTELPSALAPADGTNAFRAPRLSREDAADPSPSRIAAPTFAATGVAAPAIDAPAPAATAVQDAVEQAITDAASTPTFHDDVIVPAPAMPAVPGPAPVADPPAVEHEPAVQHSPAPQRPTMLHSVPEQPTAAVAGPVTNTAPPVEPKLAATDADVFPPSAMTPASPEPVTHHPMPPATAPAMPAPASAVDAAADVWSEIPLTAVPHAVVAAIAPVVTPLDAPVAPAPSFAEAFGDAAAVAAHDVSAEPVAPFDALPTFEMDVPAAAPLAEEAATARPVHGAPGIPEPDRLPETGPASAALGGPPIDADLDASVAFDRDRGFDWGGAEPSADRPRRGFSIRRSREKGGAAAAPVASPDRSVVVAPEVVFEPSDEALPAPARTGIGFVEIVAIVLLAVIAGLAGSKIVANRGIEAQVPVAPAADALPEIAPPTVAEPVATKPAAKKPAAKKPAAKKAAARKRTAAERVPKISEPVAAPGNAVADAAAAAGTTTTAAASKPAGAQVPAGTADTRVVTAAAAQDSSNPFARP